MSTLRPEIRAAVRAALTVALPDVTWPRAWWTKTTLGNLPRGGVGTPRESAQLIDPATSERVVDLLVVLKRVGGDDIEDHLDADSALIEAAVLPVLSARTDRAWLAETAMDVDSSAEKPVGEINLLFRAVSYALPGAA